MDLRALKRVRYFAGQALGAEDFAAEQDYFRRRQRRHNRRLHGMGIVSGLKVGIRGGTLSVEPGLALDCGGEEIEIPGPAEIPLPGGARGVYLTLQYAERETDPVPDLTGEGGMQNCRVEETFELAFPDQNPCAGHRREKWRWLPCGRSHGIPLARLIRSRGGWRVDRRFRPPRLEP